MSNYNVFVIFYYLIKVKLISFSIQLLARLKF